MVSKWFKVALLSCVFAGAMLSRGARAEDTVPTPAKLDNKDVIAYVVVQDVKKALDNVERIAKQVMPAEEFEPGKIAQQLGKEIGDPTLASIGTKPLVIMFFQMPENYNPNVGPPPMAVFIPIKDAGVLEKKFKEKQAEVDVIDGTMVVAPTPEAMAKARAAMADYSKIASAKLPCDARAYVNISSILLTFGPKMKSSLAGFRGEGVKNIKQAQEDPQFEALGIKPDVVIQLLHLMCNTAEGLIDQAGEIQLDLTVKNDSVLIEPILSGKAGTLFADLLSGTPQPSNPNVLSFLQKGFQMSYANLDKKAMSAVVRRMIAAVANDPNTADLARSPFVTKMAQSIDAMGGEYVYSTAPNEKGGLETLAVGTVLDESKYLAMQESITSMFGKDSLFSKIYQNLGMTFELNFEKNIRQHSGIPIHRMNLVLEMPMQTEEQAAAMKKNLPKPEMALVKGMSLTSSNPAKLDDMIDKTLKGDFTPSGVTLKSMTAFGKNKNLYVDYDVVAYMKHSMNMVDPNGAGAKAFQNMKSSEPMLFALQEGDGRAKMQIELPFGPFIEVVKTFGKLQQGIVPKKPDTNDGKF